MRRSLVVLSAALVAAGLELAAGCSSDDPAVDAAAPDAAAAKSDGQPPGPGADGGPEAGPATGSEIGRSGSRLKQRGDMTPEGLFVQRAAHDVLEKEDCHVGRTEDGVFRCIPLNAYPLSGMYADDRCTMLLAQSSREEACPGPPSKFAYDSIVDPANPCDLKKQLYEVVGKAAPARVWVKGTPGCVEIAPLLDVQYWSVGAPVTPTALVAMRPAEVPVSATLRASVWEGEDGSRLGGQLVDAMRGKPCSIYRTSDGRTHCAPRSSHLTRDRYSDGTCRSRVADPPQCTVPGDLYDDSTAQIFELDTCKGPEVRAFTLGQKRASRETFTGLEDGGCAGPTTATNDVIDVGAEITPASMPEVLPGTLGGPRIVQETSTSEGIPVRRGSLRDTTMNKRCELVLAADDKRRCLPIQIGAYGFSDDRCQVPISVLSNPPCEPVTHIARSTGCKSAIHLPGARLDPALTTYWIASGTDCQAVPVPSGAAVYALGAEVPASSFAEATEATR